MAARRTAGIVRRASVALLALVVAAAPPPGLGQLPSLGSAGDMSASAERRLGDRIARDIRRDPDYLEDAVLQQYVDQIWHALRAAARARGELDAELDERFAWDVMIIRDRGINAFALPGGYFGVHLGLIAMTARRDELAAVLAHEMTHVTQRHLARIFGRQNQQTPWVIGAMILAALAVSRSPDAANAAIVGSQAMAAQSQLNFSRDMEREADRIGLAVMQEAGFDPRGAASMFERLLHANRLNDSGAFPYLRSHPLTTERIAEMNSRVQFQPTPGGADPGATRPPPSDAATGSGAEHALAAARARVLAQPGVDSWRSLVDQSQPEQMGEWPPARRVPALYAGALAASRLQRHDEALRRAQALEREVAGQPALRPWARWLRAEVLLAAGQAAAAFALLNLNADARAEWLLAAQAGTASGQAAAVAQRLRQWLATHPADAPAWDALEAASQAQGQVLRSLRAAAEARWARGDLTAAVDRFKAAQQLARQGLAAGDHFEASIIDARLREAESALREQALER